MIPNVLWPSGLMTTFVETSKYSRSDGWFHRGRWRLMLEVCCEEVSSLRVVVLVVVKMVEALLVGSFITDQCELSVRRVSD